MDTLSSISFNFRKDRKPLYVITDPDCSYCSSLMPDLEAAVMEAGLELKVIIYPVLGSRRLQGMAPGWWKAVIYSRFDDILALNSKMRKMLLSRLADRIKCPMENRSKFKAAASFLFRFFLRVLIVLAIAGALAFWLYEIRPKPEKKELVRTLPSVRILEAHPRSKVMTVDAFGTVAPWKLVKIAVEVK